MFLPSRTTSSVSSVVNIYSRKVSAEMTSKTAELGKEQYINFLYYSRNLLKYSYNSELL